MSSPSDPSNQASSVLDLSSASAMALPGGIGSDSGSVTSSSAVELRERSPPLTRRALSGPRRSREHSDPYPNLTAQASYTQNILNVGASPQEVLDAQRLAAAQAAQQVADHAEQLHAVRLEQVENEARGLVEATVEQMREQLQQYEHRYDEILQQGRILEEQLSVAKAELSKVEAELQVARAGYQELEAALTSCRGDNNLLNFQNTQLRVELQVKDREIQRLRQAALSATSPGSSPPKPAPRQQDVPSAIAPSACSGGSSWVHIGSDGGNNGAPSLPQVVNESTPCPPATVSDPRVDQLIDVVQQLLAQRNGTGQGCNDASPVHEIEEPERRSTLLTTELCCISSLNRFLPTLLVSEPGKTRCWSKLPSLICQEKVWSLNGCLSLSQLKKKTLLSLVFSLALTLGLLER